MDINNMDINNMDIKEYIELANQTVSKFDITDWVIFKACLVLTGILLGSTFKKSCRKLWPLLFVACICSSTWTLIRLFIAPSDR
ncbi:MAG: hypothetical protein BEN18_08735 [Epulopiscium sp. Nuni2H_MBin001]|nr:MAG: hypothetical protein BEN18_08735 [Epulopiscium sp. Nuni2H_MBin001]